MMKMRLCFLLAGVLLSLASSARGDFTINVRTTDGTVFNPASDTLDIGESLRLDIMLWEMFFSGNSGEYKWDLICDSSLGTITGGSVGLDAYWGSILSSGTWSGGDGRGGSFAYDPQWSGFEYNPGIYAWSFLYSPQSSGSVTIELLGNDGSLSPPNERPLEIIDSLVINQTPEPTTLMLLLMGGLVLLRGKRQV